MKIVYPIGATPIDPDESDGLIPTSVSTLEELNQFEQMNISAATIWVTEVKKSCLNIDFITSLHEKMFDQTWNWAGQFRKSNKNIGKIDWTQVPTQLKQLCDDVEYWIKNKTYNEDEIAVRFHHRLTEIHPFPNGNGRHARLITNKLLTELGKPKFTWGSGNLTKTGVARKAYIEALKKADHHNLAPLLKFCRA